jgi:hypothetical protein
VSREDYQYIIINTADNVRYDVDIPDHLASGVKEYLNGMRSGKDLETLKPSNEAEAWLKEKWKRAQELSSRVALKP